MRAAPSIRLVSALTLVLGCSDTSGPSPAPSTNPAPAPILALTVAPATATINAGETVRLTATRTALGTQLLSGDARTSWSSSNNAVATVDANGLVRGTGAGTVEIAADLGGAHGSARVTVIGMRKTDDPHPCSPAISLVGNKC